MDMLVDPVVFALPAIEETDEVRMQYIHHLVCWNDELRTSNHNFFVSEACILALYDSERYPSMDALQNLWSFVGEEAIDYRDVFRACKRLFMNTPYLEDRVSELREVIVDRAGVQVRPDLILRLQNPIASAFRETLGHIAYARVTVTDSVASGMLLVTHPVNGNSLARINAPIESKVGSQIFEADVVLVSEPDDLLALISLSEIWQDTKQAIQWARQKMIREKNLAHDSQMYSFKTAPSFNKSIQKYHYERRPNQLIQIFRKCVLLLSDNLPYDKQTHHGLGQPNPHRVNGWLAWRLHITGSPVALRLHYWRRENDFIFMQVAPHENYDIGDPSEACKDTD